MTFYKRLLILSFCVVGLSSVNASNVRPADNETFTILSSKQSITFDIEKNELVTTLSIEEVIQCNVKTGEYFKKFLFFDNTSEIKNIVLNGSFTKPIISDEIPRRDIFHSDSKLAYVDFRFGVKTKNLKIESNKIFNDFKFIDLLRFQLYGHEVIHSEISIEIPNWLDCDIQKFNFDGYNVIATTENKKKSIIYTFIAKNIPADQKLKAEPDFRQYKPHIMLLPKQMTINNGIKALLPDVNSLYTWYNNLAKDAGNDKTVLQGLVKDLTKDKTSDIDKIKSIFYYIQNNIKYVAFEHGIMGFKPESCQTVFNNKFGDCKGMSNLAKEMLEMVGIDARLTWLGTDGIPYNYDFPSVYVDNHVICTVILDGKYIFLDPTEKNIDILKYADRIQGREVMIQNGDKYIRSTIPLQNSEDHLLKNELKVNMEGDQINGDGQIVLKGNAKKEFTSYLESSSEKNKEKALNYYLSKNNNNFVGTSTQKDILPQRDEDFSLNYSFIAKNQIIESGNEKYINLEFDRTLSSMEIEENRNCNYFHGYKYFEESITELKIPSNHTVKYLPESISENDPIGSFHLSYEVKDGRLFYHKKLALNKTEIPMAHFPKWKKMIKQLKDFYDDRVVMEVAK